uniref:Preprotein translocase subunit Y n=1 Tax=Nitzschia sp. PL1-4 TaxID=2083272 RepID=A0A2Z5ZAD1_9STRA|nr:preprotein translocase subunit Y [Nitzschia sp. PL1-4]
MITILIKKFIITSTILLIIIIGDSIPIPETISFNNKDIYGLFYIGIDSYINANLLVHLYIFFSPKLKKLKNESDPYLHTFIEKSTKIITITLIIFKSIFASLFLKKFIPEYTFTNFSSIFLSFLTGASILLLFNELITKYGLGNGTNIIASYKIVKEIVSVLLSLTKITKSEKTSLLGISFIIFYLSFSLAEYYKKIPLVLGERLEQLEIQKKFNFYLPLSLNQAGMSSISFASSILKFIPLIGRVKILYPIFIILFGCFFNFFYTIFLIDLVGIFIRFKSLSILVKHSQSHDQSINIILKEFIILITIAPLITSIITILPSFLGTKYNLNILLLFDSSEIYTLISSLSSIYIDIESTYLLNKSIY